MLMPPTPILDLFHEHKVSRKRKLSDSRTSGILISQLLSHLMPSFLFCFLLFLPPVRTAKVTRKARAQALDAAPAHQVWNGWKQPVPIGRAGGFLSWRGGAPGLVGPQFQARHLQVSFERFFFLMVVVS